MLFLTGALLRSSPTAALRSFRHPSARSLANRLPCPSTCATAALRPFARSFSGSKPVPVPGQQNPFSSRFSAGGLFSRAFQGGSALTLAATGAVWMIATDDDENQDQNEESWIHRIKTAVFKASTVLALAKHSDAEVEFESGGNDGGVRKYKVTP